MNGLARIIRNNVLNQLSSGILNSRKFLKNEFIFNNVQSKFYSTDNSREDVTQLFKNDHTKKQDRSTARFDKEILDRLKVNSLEEHFDSLLGNRSPDKADEYYIKGVINFYNAYSENELFNTKTLFVLAATHDNAKYCKLSEAWQLNIELRLEYLKGIELKYAKSKEVIEKAYKEVYDFIDSQFEVPKNLDQKLSFELAKRLLKASEAYALAVAYRSKK